MFYLFLIIRCNCLMKPLQIYIEYCVKNPAYKSGETIQCELFKTKLDELVKQSPIFKS